MGDNKRSRRFLLSAVALGLVFTFTACHGARRDKTSTIGVVIDASFHIPLLEGFKAGMAELGYAEGETVEYIYNGPIDTDPEVIEREIESLLAQDVDMLFTAGSAITLKARRAVSGKAIPVVFAAVASPVERGVVDSIPQPGGDLTGVQVGLEIPKALQWLVTIVPGAKKVYVPYNPDEEVSTITLAALDKAAAQLGIQIIGGQVHSVEEAVVAIESLPEDVGAVFRIPSPTLDSRNDELSRAAIRRRLPMGAGLPLDEAVLFTFAADMFAAGKQAARLAGRIREGVDPADLPVESAEIFLAINLKTAEAIGLDIQDTILLQADTIIR